MTASVLVVQHEPQCPPGWLGEWLSSAGVTLDVRHPYAGDRLPADLHSHEGLVVLGGHMGANDDDAYPWLVETKALVRAAAGAGTPALGVCLGHQLAAVALGGEVVVNPAGQRRGVLEMGWLDEAASDPLVAACGRRAVMWHHDVVRRAPEGSRALAIAATGELLTARFAPTVWGVQCHPEAGAEVVRGWADADCAAASGPAETAAVAADHAAVVAAREELRAGWEPLAKAFAALL